METNAESTASYLARNPGAPCFGTRQMGSATESFRRFETQYARLLMSTYSSQANWGGGVEIDFDGAFLGGVPLEVLL